MRGPGGTGRGGSLAGGAVLTMFWSAQAVSLFGDRLNNFSLAALVGRFSSDPSLQLSGIYLAMYLPVFLLAPLAGVLIDRVSKRWVLVVTDLARGLIVLAIPTLFASSGSFLPVMGAVFLVSAGNLFFLPAKSGLLPELFSPGDLVRVNSILWTAGIAGFAAGFLGGGLIFDYVSWKACFYLDAATYIVSSALLLTMVLKLRSVPAVAEPGPARAGGFRPAAAGLLRSALEGLSALRRDPSLRRPLGLQALIFFGAGGFSVLALVMVGEASPPGSSMGLAAAGISAGLGMSAGTLAVNRMSPSSRRRAEPFLLIAVIPATAGVATGSLLPLCAGAFLAGGAVTPLYVLSEASLQERIKPILRGRIFSLREILTRSLFLISSFMMSILGKAAGRAQALTGLGLFLAIAGVVWIRYSQSVSAEDG